MPFGVSCGLSCIYVVKTEAVAEEGGDKDGHYQGAMEEEDEEQTHCHYYPLHEYNSQSPLSDEDHHHHHFHHQEHLI